MKQIIKRGSFLTLMFMLLGCLSLYAADNDLITRQITIQLEKAGTLPDRIASSRKYKITNLKIIGEINGTDLRMIREMAGRDYIGNSTDGKLSVLDLSEAKIVEGGDCYYNDYYTSNDVIGKYAFRDCRGLTSLNLPAGITSIGYGAFADCSGLTSLNLHAGITEIGDDAFYHCSGLTSLNLPTGITKIGGYAFYYCSGLTSLTLPAGITEISYGIFEGCSGLTSLNLPAGITKIGDDAFRGCSGLTSLTLPAGITSIYDRAFWGCSGLTSLNLPAGITKISDGAFEGCSGLTSLTLPAGITEIGSDAFWGCSGLTSLTLPAGITKISDGAFEWCSGLTSLTLPAGITEIGESAFYGCSGLTSLTLPAGINSIGASAFRDCSGLTSLTLPAGITSIGDHAFRDCSGLTSLTLPAGITRIGSQAFRGCSGLMSFNLPAGITEIGASAFQDCSGLTSIYVYAEKVPKIDSNVFEGFDAKKCTLYVPMGTYDDYLVSDFGDYFENIVEFEATGINKITINLEKAGTLPDSIGSSRKYKITNLKIIGEINGTDLRMIREMAGSNSTDGKLSVLDLSEAKIVEGGDCYYIDGYNYYYYTSNDVIGSCAFWGCSGLTSLNLPAGITEIGDHAFQHCSGLTSIYVYAEKVPKIDSKAFEGFDAKKCTLYVPMGTRDDYRLSKFGYFENIVEFYINKITINLEKAGTLPDRIASSDKYKITNLKIIGEINGTDLRMIREMAGRDYIGNSTDGKLSVLDLSEAKIVEGGDCYYDNYYTFNDVIGDYAFQRCSGLTSLTLPAGITSIGSLVFDGCSGLTSLTLSAGITSIGDGAFWGCSGLKEVRFCINDNLDTYLTKGHPCIDVVDCGIRYYINDKEITSIEIPSNVTTLGDYVFQGCRGLTSLTLPARITEIGNGAFYDCSGLTSLTLPARITYIGTYAFEGCSGLTSIYVYAEKVPKIGGAVFKGVDAKECTLYVPMGTSSDYRLSGFGDYFENIVEFDATGIDKTTTSTDVEEVARYSVNGQRLSAPTKGLNIVKYSDGSVKKVAVQ